MVSTLVLGVALFGFGQEPKARANPATAASAADPALRDQYNALRAQAADTADAHWKLGVWCEQKGLKAEAELHFMLVLQRDPSRDGAWKKLGYVKHNGRWSTPDQVAAERAELDAQRKADVHWRPLLQKWRAAVGRKDKRAEAEAALADVKEPRAVPSIWHVFGTGSPDDQERAIDMLGHIDGERASRAIAGLAIFGKTDVVRRDAVETLKRRKADDVLMTWIGLLRPPIKYEVRQVAGPGSPGVLLVEGETFKIRSFYAPPSVQATQSLFLNPLDSRTMKITTDSKPPPGPPAGSKYVGHSDVYGDLFIFDYHWAPPPPPPPPPGPTAGYQQFETSVLQAQIDRDFAFGEAAKMAAGAEAQLEHDVNTIEAANGVVRERNARISEALRQIAGVDLGEDRDAWMKWWMKRIGYTYSPPKDPPKPTVDVQVPLPYVPASGPPRLTAGGGDTNPKYCVLWEHDKNRPPKFDQCFGARTLVLTPLGHRAIATLKVGELVVTSDHLTDRIAKVHAGQTDRILRVVVGGEAILTTEGHPFLKPGTGWTRAGNLRSGDDIATLRGATRVESTEILAGARVWNLRLLDGSSFVVGRVGCVVHDLSPVDVSRGAAAALDSSRPEPGPVFQFGIIAEPAMPGLFAALRDGTIPLP